MQRLEVSGGTTYMWVVRRQTVKKVFQIDSRCFPLFLGGGAQSVCSIERVIAGWHSVTRHVCPHSRCEKGTPGIEFRAAVSEDVLPPYSWWKDVFHNPAAVYVSPCSPLGARFSICATHCVSALLQWLFGFQSFDFIVREGVDWINLGRGTDCWRAAVDAVINLRVS